MYMHYVSIHMYSLIDLYRTIVASVYEVVWHMANTYALLYMQCMEFIAIQPHLTCLVSALQYKYIHSFKLECSYKAIQTLKLLITDKSLYDAFKGSLHGSLTMDCSTSSSSTKYLFQFL